MWYDWVFLITGLIVWLTIGALGLVAMLAWSVDFAIKQLGFLPELRRALQIMYAERRKAAGRVQGG